MNTKIISLLSAAVLVLALSSKAKADTCATSSTTSCSIDLTVSNGFAPAGTDFGTVTLTLGNGSNGGAVGTIVVNIAMNTGYGLHSSDFGFNGTNGGTVSATVNSYTFSGFNGGKDPGTPTFEASGFGNQDGFGSFLAGLNGGTGSSSDYTSLNFTVSSSNPFTAVSQLLAGNDVSTTNWFGGQVSFFIVSGCTGFFDNAGGINTSIGTTSQGVNCVSTSTSTTVPEPGTLALFGTGALGLAGFLRRKLFA